MVWLIASVLVLLILGTVQYSVTLRNNQLDQVESTAGTAPLLRIYTGAQPADCATVASGTKLWELALPTDWMNNASGGSKTKLGTWSGAAVATGTAGYWRLYDSAGTNCHAQGSITATGGGGDMTLDNTSIANGQTVTVNTFTVTAGNP